MEKVDRRRLDRASLSTRPRLLLSTGPRFHTCGGCLRLLYVLFPMGHIIMPVVHTNVLMIGAVQLTVRCGPDVCDTYHVHIRSALMTPFFVTDGLKLISVTSLLTHFRAACFENVRIT